MVGNAAAVIGGTMLAVILLLGLLAWRRVRLIRSGGIDVVLRIQLDTPSRWHQGVARYQGEEFAWYRLISLRTRPDTVVRRDSFTIMSRRDPTGPELYALPSDATVLRCSSGEDELELVMTPDALTGFLSWLESAPPGRAVPWAS